MEVEYSLDVADVLDLRLYVSSHVPAARWRLRLGRVGGPMVFILLWLAVTGWAWHEGLAIVLGVMLASAAAVWFLLYPSVVRACEAYWLRRLHTKGRAREWFGRRRLALTPESITESGDLTVATRKWAAIERIVEDERHVFLFVAGAGAVIVPKPALASADRLREFLDAARLYHREAAG